MTAIRETFEELGILICKRKGQLADTQLTSSVVHEFDVEFWQKEVLKIPPSLVVFKVIVNNVRPFLPWQIFNDATKFIKLCEQLDVVPDIWSLHEWSIWLTPTWKRTKRFETVFYLVGVDEQPDINVENNEVQNSWVNSWQQSKFEITIFIFDFNLQWRSPDELLQLNRLGKNWLPPPQLYELSRLSNEPNLDKLLPFAKARGANSPTTLIFPIHFHTSDGLIHCYPGDDFYPKNPNYNKTSHDLEQYADKTCAECRSMAKNLHRAELKSINEVDIWQNIGNFDDHLSPDTTKIASGRTSKL